MHVIELHCFECLHCLFCIALHQRSHTVRCLSGVQAELLELVGHDCSYASGATQEKLQQFFTDRMFFEHISGKAQLFFCMYHKPRRRWWNTNYLLNSDHALLLDLLHDGENNFSMQ